MEKKSNLALLIPIEELQSKFKSKLDLYRVMSIDSKYFQLVTYSELFSSAI